MQHNRIANLRLISQQIVHTKFESVKDIVAWMGAIQAQDFRMTKWAIGLRLKKATEATVNEAINSGQILRTHVLRPTWHFVSADDIYRMLQLTAPKIRMAMKGRNKQLELDDTIFKKSNSVLERSLRNNNHLTRKELLAEFKKSNIATDNNRASHILLNAELDGIICSGKMKGEATTYALLEEVVAKRPAFDKEKALYELASKYFQSRCPATLQDFIWWSGLSVKDGKQALTLIEKDFCKEKINGKEYILPKMFKLSKSFKESAFLLPSFDEFLISYKDRSDSVAVEDHSKSFSNNGIFWPIVVENGKVTGTWKREIKKTKTIITIDFFNFIKKENYSLLQHQSEKLGYFLNSKTELIISERNKD